MPTGIYKRSKKHKINWFQKGRIPWNKKPDIIKICSVCKKEFKIKPYRVNTAIYCSSKCYGKSRKKIIGYWLGRKRSEITKEKIRQKTLEQFKNGMPEETKIKIKKNARRGKNNPNWRGGPIKKKCIVCNKEFEVKRDKENTAKCCSRECKYKWQSKFYSRENHPGWIDGRSYLPYSLEFNENLKEKIRQRDVYICQRCNRTQEKELKEFGIRLAIHHIDYNKQNNKKDNLITLCLRCNTKVNKNRNYWIKYFQETIVLQNSSAYIHSKLSTDRILTKR